MSSLVPFPKDETALLIDGPVGPLQVVAASCKGEYTCNTTLVICHPHPLFGGTMENKVVTTVFRTFVQAGFDVVRFNYRGVGKSAGTFDDTIGETEDLLAIIKWVQAVKPNQSLWLAGFSFGAFVAAKGALRSPCKQLISLAPPTHHYDFAGLATMTCPWLVIQPDADEVVPPESVYDWVATSAPAHVQLIKIPKASHFFHGKLIELREVLQQTLRLTP